MAEPAGSPMSKPSSAATLRKSEKKHKHKKHSESSSDVSHTAEKKASTSSLGTGDFRPLFKAALESGIEAHFALI